MPVELVELEPGHLVEQPEDLLLVEEVAAHVEHRPAPAEGRFVGDLRTGNLRFPDCAGREQLPQRGDAVRRAARRSGGDADARAGDREAVGLFGQRRRIRARA